MKRTLIVIICILTFINIGMANMDTDNAQKGEETLKIYNTATGQYEDMQAVQRSEDEWKEQLSDLEYHVTREHGTERAFTGDLHDNKEEGVYKCKCCGIDLFHSDHKFDSRTGWPSFYQPVAEENVATETDTSFFMVRTEVHCPRCGCHLGHIFDDGPQPTGKRYCINSASLDFEATEE